MNNDEVGSFRTSRVDRITPVTHFGCCRAFVFAKAPQQLIGANRTMRRNLLCRSPSSLQLSSETKFGSQPSVSLPPSPCCPFSCLVIESTSPSKDGTRNLQHSGPRYCSGANRNRRSHATVCDGSFVVYHPGAIAFGTHCGKRVSQSPANDASESCSPS